MAKILDTIKHVDGTYVVCLDCDVPVEFALAFFLTDRKCSKIEMSNSFYLRRDLIGN